MERSKGGELGLEGVSHAKWRRRIFWAVEKLKAKTLKLKGVCRVSISSRISSCDRSLQYIPSAVERHWGVLTQGVTQSHDVS